MLKKSKQKNAPTPVEVTGNEEKVKVNPEPAKKEVTLNVIDNDEFKMRVAKVFKELGKVLSKSYGPHGSNTFIGQFPYYSTTKDGYTIMKNVRPEDPIDVIIANMAESICSRLNYSVGDGTTTAIIATNSIYEAFVEFEHHLKDKKILPRDVLKAFNEIKTEIIDMIRSEATPINYESIEELKSTIQKIVYISSNGDEEITNLITDLYAELGYPAINVVMTQDGYTKSKIVEGYSLDITLTDEIYINSDDKTRVMTNVDVIVFDHKVTENTYRKILSPMSMACASLGRQLLVIAPQYDEVALTGIIRRDLLAEFNKTKHINMVLTACTNSSAMARILLGDLAMLLNTMVINKSTEEDIIKLVDSGRSIQSILNIDDRDIPDIKVVRLMKSGENEGYVSINSSENVIEGIEKAYDSDEYHMRLGFAKSCVIGMKESLFSGFYYDEEFYKKHLVNADNDLKEAEKKYQRLGTFNVEVAQKQRRLYALKLKMGTIEVGGTSEISQGMLKDAVDDAVKAAKSAFNNGYILGCNVTLISCLHYLYEDQPDSEEDSIKAILLKLLIRGFTNVYKTVLTNWASDIVVEPYKSNAELNQIAKKELGLKTDLFEELNGFDKVVDEDTIFSYIVGYSVDYDVVFDLSKKVFSKDIINSSETDIEVLNATIDLISLIISGNQLVVSGIR